MKISIKSARVNAGLNLKETAEKLKISRDSLRNIEAGKVSPRVDLAYRMVELYNCTLNDIDFSMS